MSALQPTEFAAFFAEVYGKNVDDKPIEPFPWQQRLVERVCRGNWPKCIALPTAAGKTACIDVAVFALACQANLPPEERTAPRRIFFVVDRRVVVDQAFEHAKKLSTVLADAHSGVLRRVADALRHIGADAKRPLDVYALRGGMYRDSAWVRSPLQPTIITSTVDQVGSRLLFRGYGVSDSCRPLHAALVANDALILLDEAHCAKPFDQTMALVEKYRSWADEPLRSPFHFVTMTATPSSTVPDGQIERDRADDHAHSVLGPRFKASKRARLMVAKKATGKKWRDGLVEELAKQARALGCEAVGVIVNRVATARALAKELDAILVTGRMRPMDRERLKERLRPLLSNSPGTPPQFVVATQCLEVGADFDFHALVTECASLDALRQRFGRLNRVAARDDAKAAIVVRADQVEPAKSDADVDPVYGNSLAQTWQWLNGNKDGADDGVPWIDFGVESIGKKYDATPTEQRDPLNMPAPDAAVLLPAHLDLWCQTSPIPAPDPDPAVFLHGPQRGVPDVQVVFRADLGDDPQKWAEIVSFCPPSSSEALPTRVDVFRRWMAGEVVPDESSDLEGEPAPPDETSESTDRQALRWYGAHSERTAVVVSPDEVRPNETYIVPIAEQEDYSPLGDFLAERPDDLGDQAFQIARDRAVLRLTPLVHKALPSFDNLTMEDEDAVNEAITAAIDVLKSDADELIRQAAEHLAKGGNRYRPKQHPCGGIVLIGKKRLQQFNPAFTEAEESWEATSGRPVPLADHCDAVAALASQFGQQAGLKSEDIDALETAGRLHDAGKADPRFQAWLHNGNRRRADLFPQRLAKSLVSMPKKGDRSAARELAGYPKCGRHELHSVRLAECDGALPTDSDIGDLVLHLIASHHGYCRPFAPVVDDADAEPFTHDYQGHVLQFVPETGSVSGHGLERLDSGVAERFWKLTRRFGWWGLPWLESMLRLADWSASEAAERGTDNEQDS